MNLKISLILSIICVFLLRCTSTETNSEASDKSPNVMFLFADDMTYSAVHALGNDEISTPNLDRLVKKGATFSNAYNMGGWNGAICVASRAMIISGRSIWRAQDYKKNWENKDSLSYNKTWSRLMENAGYDTYMTGKWHVSAPADVIFQNANHIRPGMPGHKWRHREVLKGLEDVASGKMIDGRKITIDDVMPLGYNRPLSVSDTTWSPADTAQGGFWKGGKHWSEVVKDDALEFIEKAKSSENPFFMYLAFNAPHDHRQAPQEYIDMYPLDDITLPASFKPEHPYKELIGNERTLRDEALAPYPRTEYAVKVHMQEYYAIISHLDTQVGLILDALEASGKMDNTYIFFSADHGLSVGRHGLLGKQSMYEHSVRVPMMVSGPDIPANSKIQRNVYLQDLMATALEIAGVEKPEYVEFNSLLGQAKGISREGGYNEIYGAYVDFQRMIKKNDYKLIVYPKAQKMMLFNLAADPKELEDLIEDSSQKERIDQLFVDLQELQKKMGDDLLLNREDYALD